VLAAGTDNGHLFPTDGAYTPTALIGIAAVAVTAMTSIDVAGKRTARARADVRRSWALLVSTRAGHPADPMERMVTAACYPLWGAGRSSCA
jgi:hypothetical protein